ncbi:MAG: chemotaxis protein CheA [Bacteroidales bacterium]|nr:chemotaxis protein CheA [Bacteroidales bacterium]
MQEFQDRFTDEARELIAGIESEVIGLESNPNDKLIIDEIFRVMHTLKGTASMFGFNSIESITHHLESLYDSIRDDRMKINAEIINLTFATIDIIKKILDTKDNLNKNDQKHFDGIVQDLNKITGLPQEPHKEPPNPLKDSGEKMRAYYILYKPDENILFRGVKPFGVFYELSDIGRYKAIPFLDKMPILEIIDLDKFYLYWDIFFISKAPPEEVRDVFMFFESNEAYVVELDYNKLDKESIKDYTRLSARKLPPEKIRDIFASLLTHEGIEIERPELVVPKKEEDVEVETALSDIEHRTREISQKSSTMRVSSEKLDHLITNVSEFVTLYSQIALMVDISGYDELTKPIQSLGKLSKKLRDNALDLRLLPLDELTLKLRRLIRDLAQKLNKEVSFITEGTDTELDKTIISHLEEPLMHIIRNSLDHGIEDRETRLKMHKSPTGIIRLTSFYSGAYVFIQVQDDGAGIDPDVILKKAVEKGLAPQDVSLSKREIYDFVFLPGFSTAQQVSKVSGRGVGMDVVKQKINELRGEIEIDSEVNLGTSVTIKLPLTLSIIDTLKVMLGDSLYLVPLSAVEICLRVNYREILDNPKKQFEFEEKFLPVIILRDEFSINGQYPEYGRIVIIKQYEKKYGLLVDQVLGEHQAVVKPLGDLHKKHDFFTGVSIMGDGSLALILDTGKMLMMKKEMQNVNL